MRILNIICSVSVAWIVSIILFSSFSIPVSFADDQEIESLIRGLDDLKAPLTVYRVTKSDGKFTSFYTQLDRDKIKSGDKVFEGTSVLGIAELILKGSYSIINDRLNDALALEQNIEDQNMSKTVTQSVTLAKRELIKTYRKIPVFFGEQIPNRLALYKMTRDLIGAKDSKLYKNFSDVIYINTSAEKFESLTEETNTNLKEFIKMYLHGLLKLAKASNKRVVLFIEDIDQFKEEELKIIVEFNNTIDLRNRIMFAGTSEDIALNINVHNSELTEKLFTPLPTTDEKPLDLKDSIIVQLYEQGISDPQTLLDRVKTLEEKYDVKIDDSAILTLAKSKPIQESIQLQKSVPQIPAGVEIQEGLIYLEDAVIQHIEKHENSGDPVNPIMSDDLLPVLRKIQSATLNLPFDPSNLKAKLAYKKSLIEKISKKVIGQERLVEDIVNLYLRIITNPAKNIGTMAMLGPTGTGKTLSTETFAEVVYGSKDAIFTINGSEFQGHAAVSELRKLFGAPPSYIGHDETRGSFVEWMEDEKKGYNGGIIVINEADKANNAFWQYFMEFLDGKGIQKNGGGTREQQKKKGASEPVLKANNHIVILTTNQGDKFLYPEELKKLSDKELKAWIDNLTQSELKNTFVNGGNNADQAKLHPSIPERIEVFSPAYLLTEEVARKIVKNEIGKITNEYINTYGIHLNWDQSIEDYFISVFFDKMMGARRIINAVQSQIQKNLEHALEDLNSTENDVVSISVDKVNAGYNLKVDSSEKSVSYKVEGLTTPDAVKDPEMLSRLQNFESKMKERLYGQEYAIHTVSQAARGKMSFLDKRGRPLSITIVGASGVGKTETFRATAHAWYGSEDRLRVISLEDVQNIEEIFGNIVDSYQQNNPMRLFEKALNDNKEGGVILFDEIDKIGGGNPYLIRQFMLKMHSVLEEGVWRSPSGKEYQLGKYIIGFSSNFLSKLFDGISRYEAQKSIWEENRSRDHLTRLLVDSYKLSDGSNLIPDSFIKRQDVVLLAEPLAPEDTLKITKKHIEKELGFFEKELGTKLIITDKFINDLTKAYFSLGSGAGRAVRNILRSHIKSYVNMVRADLQQRFVAGEADINIDKLEVELSLEDNLPARAYITDLSWERKVKVALKSTIDGKVVDDRKYDVSKTVPDKRRRAAKDSLKTSYHEAGHAVANVVEKTLIELKLITIFSEDGYLGVNIFDDIKNTAGTNFSWETARYRIAMSLAGERAQVLAGFSEDTGQSGDQNSVDRIIRYILIKGKFHPDVKGIQFDDKGQFMYPSESARKKFEALVQKMYAESEKLADELLVKNWNLVRAVTALLMKQGDISGDEYAALKKKIDSEQAKGELPKWILNNSGHVVKLDKDTIIGRFMARRKEQTSRLRNLDPKLGNGKCESDLLSKK